MKKRLAVVLALVLVVAMMLCACGGSGKTDKIDFATGGTSGTYYGFIGSVATTLNEESGMDITVESTGASQANVQLIQIGENNMAIIQNDIMSYAYNGQFMFEGNAFQGMSVVMSCYPEDIQIVASPNVSSIEDLAGRTVSVGASDSGTRYNAEQILASYGITQVDVVATAAPPRRSPSPEDALRSDEGERAGYASTRVVAVENDGRRLIVSRFLTGDPRDRERSGL